MNLASGIGLLEVSIDVVKKRITSAYVLLNLSNEVRKRDKM